MSDLIVPKFGPQPQQMQLVVMPASMSRDEFLGLKKDVEEIKRMLGVIVSEVGHGEADVQEKEVVTFE